MKILLAASLFWHAFSYAEGPNLNSQMRNAGAKDESTSLSIAALSVLSSMFRAKTILAVPTPAGSTATVPSMMADPIDADPKAEFNSQAGEWSLNKNAGGIGVFNAMVCPSGMAKADGSCRVAKDPLRIEFEKILGQTASTQAIEAVLITGSGTDARRQKLVLNVPLGAPPVPPPPPPPPPPGGCSTPKQFCAVDMGRRGNTGIPYANHRLQYDDWSFGIASAANPIVTVCGMPPRFWNGRGWIQQPYRCVSSMTAEWRSKILMSGNYQPCNREKNRPGCWLNYRALPRFYTFTDGCTYEVSNADGSCGTADCPCLVYAQVSPLVVSWKGEAVKFTEVGKGVEFDFGLGSNNSTRAWIANPSSSRFLVWDKELDGKITSSNELFGDTTVGPDGSRAPNGFIALAKHDTDGNGQIDKEDPIFSELFLWSDLNRDAKSNHSELKRLDELGVVSISLQSKAEVLFGDRFGNSSQATGSLQTKEGLKKDVYDIYFVPAHAKKPKNPK
jgi:hypothetical protein